MLLSQLMRYRTQDHEHTEDYLSTVLAALLNRDPACRGPLLRVFTGAGWNAPRDLSSLQTRTQVRTQYNGRLLIPDLVMNCGDWTCIVECKHKAQPSDEQLESYRLPGVQKVAILAPSAKLGSLEGHWCQCSWEDLWVAIQSLPITHDPVAAWLREQLADLLEGEGLVGLWNMPRAQLLQGVFALQELEKVSNSVQSAVGKLYRLDLGADEESVVWSSDGPLDWYWFREEAPVGEAVVALGLVGSTPEGVVGDVLEWTLWLELAESYRNRLDKDWVKEEDGWFTRALPGNIGRTESLEASLSQASLQASSLLAQLLDGAGHDRVGHWSVPEPSDPTGVADTTVAGLKLHLALAERTQATLNAWARNSLELTRAALAAEGTEAALKQVYLGVKSEGGSHLWLWNGTHLDGEVPTLELCMSWERSGDRTTELPAVLNALAGASGIVVTEDSGTIRISASLLSTRLEQASEALATAATIAVSAALAATT